MLAKAQSREGIRFFKGAKGLADGSRGEGSGLGMTAEFVGYLTDFTDFTDFTDYSMSGTIKKFRALRAFIKF